MGGRDDIEEDDELAAARWVSAVEAGLTPAREAALHAWLAARPERAELVARQAALQDLARQAGRLQQAQARHRGRTDGRVVASRRRVLVGGGLAMAASVIGGVALFARPAGLSGGEADHAAFETAAGEVRAVELADASRLWLDARTRVSARMTPERRDVRLEAGRMFVEVAHAPERPFTVQGERFEARALGTAFEATVFADRTGVAVTEGVVRLTARDGQVIELGAGQCAWVTDAGVMRAEVAARSVGAWRQRRMVLADRRLDAALAELSRYFDRPLTVADEQLAARRVSLSFSIDGLDEEAAARVVAGAVGAGVTDRANAGILLRPMGDAGATPRLDPR